MIFIVNTLTESGISLDEAFSMAKRIVDYCNGNFVVQGYYPPVTVPLKSEVIPRPEVIMYGPIGTINYDDSGSVVTTTDNEQTKIDFEQWYDSQKEKINTTSTLPPRFKK